MNRFKFIQKPVISLNEISGMPNVIANIRIIK